MLFGIGIGSVSSIFPTPCTPLLFAFLSFGVGEGSAREDGGAGTTTGDFGRTPGGVGRTIGLISLGGGGEDFGITLTGGVKTGDG